MRDGIYKNLPLGRGWQSFLKSCERQKERGETARVKATRAIIRDLNGELGAKFFENLNARVRRGESLLPGFAVIEPDCTSRDLGGLNTPFENDVLSSAKRLQRRGIRGKEIVYIALRESIDQLKQRRFNHIEQHCALTGDTGASTRTIVDAVRTAIGSIDSTDLASQFLDSTRPKMPRFKREIDLNEDLGHIR